MLRRNEHRPPTCRYPLRHYYLQLAEHRWLGAA